MLVFDVGRAAGIGRENIHSAIEVTYPKAAAPVGR